ncbi:MAG: DUF4292 domain-containing protein [Prevotellaceae bacterium]|nr:DUF4292 domain-containing protein [Prevotellaceae bacterium]
MRHIYNIIALLFIACVITGCKSSQSTVSTTQAIKETSAAEDISFLRKVSDNYQYAQNITTKVKFSASMNGESVSLSGSLKMRRDDVIQVSLMALGFIEAARFEFTPEYALFIDRLHKTCVREKYEDIKFLKDNGLNFYSFQALFWDELFCPGKNTIGEGDLTLFSVDRLSDKADITLKKEAKPDTDIMNATSFKWTSDSKTSKITQANVNYANGKDKASLSWGYSNFKTFSRKPFPMTQNIKIETPNVKVNATVTFGNLDNNSDWNNRTALSDKYKKVSIESLFSQLAKQ